MLWRRFGLMVGLPLLALGALAWSLAPGPDQNPESHSLLGGATVRLLLVGDHFSTVLRAQAAALERQAGGTLAIEVVGYDDIRRATLQNARDATSNFDIVSFDVVWVGEYTAKSVLLPLAPDAQQASRLMLDDVLPLALRQSMTSGQLVGLPIQPHPELLWGRADLLRALGAPMPRTTDELLRLAKRLHQPAKGQYGLCWNGQRGQALGQQIAHFYGAFGQPLLDEAGRPQLDTARGLKVAQFALSLLAVSPPDILNTAWDQRTRLFSQGACALTYEWAARSHLAEEDPRSVVAGRVVYGSAPHHDGARPVTPLGTWSLGIPANIGPRRELAERFLYWISAPQQQRALALAGNGGMPRVAMLQDPELAARHPAFASVASINAAGELGDWMRPAVPQWASLADVLGTVFHDMLAGKLTAEQAVARAQREAEAAMSQPSTR